MHVRSAADENFAEVVAGEEEFDGGGVFEKFFNGAIVEILDLLRDAAGNLQQALGVLNPVAVKRNFFYFFVRVEERKNDSARAHDAKQAVDDAIDQWWSEELKGVPDERTVERVGRESESLFEEAGGFGFVLLGLAKTIAEGVKHRADDIVGRNAVAGFGEERNVSLADAGQVEDRQTFLTLEQGLELIKAAAMTNVGRGAIAGRRFSECSLRNSEFHKTQITA